MRKVDWKAFCQSFGVPVGGTRKGQWLEVRCPFCGDRKTKGAIHLESGAFHCWKCGKHSIMDFVSSYAGCSNDPRDVYRTLDPYFLEHAVRETYRHDEEEDEQQRAIRLRIRKRDKGLDFPGTKPLSKKMKQYLRSRGFNALYLTEHYDLRDGGITGDWAWRIVIPVYMDGKVVTWQARHIGHDKIRYKAAPKEESINIKDVVYNLDNCHHRSVIVVEGIFDCWKLGDDCCALFGISVKDSQLRILADRFDTVYFLFDPEPKAQKMADECARKIDMLGKRAIVLNMEDTDSSDPGDMTAQEVVQVKKLVFGDIPDYDFDTPQLRAKKEI